MSFATRLVAGTLLVLVAAVAVLLWGAERSLRQDLIGDIERSLLSEARLVREALPADSTTWDEAVHRLSRQNRHRITLVDRQGVVRADSDFPPGPLPPIQNHLDRPEIQAALRSSFGIAQVLFELPGPWVSHTAHSDVYDLKKWLISEFGPDVNLANIMPDDILETEALRVGLSVMGPRPAVREAEVGGGN